MTRIIIIGIVLFPCITSCSYKKDTEPTYNDTISYETNSRTSENCDDCITCNACKEWQALLNS